MQYKMNLEEYKKPCACANWTAPISTVVYQHKPGCDHFDEKLELAIMADKMWQIHNETLEVAIAAQNKGLFGKYILSKQDGSPVEPGAKYFILRYDGSSAERESERAALLYYCDVIESSNPELSRDLRFNLLAP